MGVWEGDLSSESPLDREGEEPHHVGRKCWPGGERGTHGINNVISLFARRLRKARGSYLPSGRGIYLKRGKISRGGGDCFSLQSSFNRQRRGGT